MIHQKWKWRQASAENAGYTFKPLPHTVSDRNPVGCLATRGTVEFCFTYQTALQVPENWPADLFEAEDIQNSVFCVYVGTSMWLFQGWYQLL